MQYLTSFIALVMLCIGGGFISRILYELFMLGWVAVPLVGRVLP